VRDLATAAIENDGWLRSTPLADFVILFAALVLAVFVWSLAPAAPPLRMTTVTTITTVMTE
jgi:hypothetical protein